MDQVLHALVAQPEGGSGSGGGGGQQQPQGCQQMSGMLIPILIMFAIMQLALVYVAKQVVSYASYSAARAAVVSDSPQDAYRRASRAGALICSPITGPTVEGSNFTASELLSDRTMIAVPGWGLLPKSGISRRLKTHVSRLDYPTPGEVEVTVISPD